MRISRYYWRMCVKKRRPSRSDSPTTSRWIRDKTSRLCFPDRPLPNRFSRPRPVSAFPPVLFLFVERTVASLSAHAKTLSVSTFQSEGIGSLDSFSVSSCRISPTEYADMKSLKQVFFNDTPVRCLKSISIEE